MAATGSLDPVRPASQFLALAAALVFGALLLIAAGVTFFGNPKAGTPLMVASPTLAIDLPLKALVSEDADGSVSISWNSPEYLQQRHGIPGDLLKNLAGAEGLLRQAAE